MFAAVHGNVIQIYSSTTFENVNNLKGHNGKVSVEIIQLVCKVNLWPCQKGETCKKPVLFENFTAPILAVTEILCWVDLKLPETIFADFAFI